jgi:hypothetical protein
LITSVVNIQLLRLGLVNHTTLGKTFQKENKDVYIIIAMFADGFECLMCLLCILTCIKLNHDVKNNRFKSKRKEGAFFVQVVSDKDIVVIQSKQQHNNNASNIITGKQTKKSNSFRHKSRKFNNDKQLTKILEGEAV